MVVQGLQGSLERSWEPLAWPIEEVLVLTRSPDPFEVRARIQVGKRGGERYVLAEPGKSLCREVWSSSYKDLAHKAPKKESDEDAAQNGDTAGDSKIRGDVRTTASTPIDTAVYGSLGKDREWRQLGEVSAKTPVRVLQYNVLADSLAEGSQRDGAPAPPPCPCARHFVEVQCPTLDPNCNTRIHEPIRLWRSRGRQGSTRTTIPTRCRSNSVPDTTCFCGNGG